MNERLPMPADFASDCPPPRLGGIEVEYGVRNPSGRLGANDINYIKMAAAARATDVTLYRIPTTANTMSPAKPRYRTPNGSLFHTDCLQVEMAGGEEIGIAAMVANRKAGRVTIGKLGDAAGVHVEARAATVGRKLPDNDPYQQRVVTIGYHPNLITPALNQHTTRSLRHYGLLDGFNATAVHTWGGMVHHLGYSLSQKVFGIGQDITTSFNERAFEQRKPMAMFRNTAPGVSMDDVNDGGFGFARYEGRAGDPSTDWSESMALAGLSLLMRIIEHPKLTNLNRELESLRLADPVASMRLVATDLSFSKRLHLEIGKTMRVADYQMALAGLAVKLSDYIQLPSEEVQAALDWREAYDQLDKHAPVGNFKELEYMGAMARLHVFSRKAGGLDFNLQTHPELLALCQDWDKVKPWNKEKPGSAIDILNKRHPVIPDEMTERALTGPLTQTRAAARMALYKSHKIRLIAENWSKVTYTEKRSGLEVTRALHPYQASI